MNSGKGASANRRRDQRGGTSGPPALAPEAGATLAALYQQGWRLLSNAGIDNASHETIWLLESVLGPVRVALQAHPEQPVSAADSQLVWTLLQRRSRREPLQYLLGSQEFWGLDVRVGPEVLIPRPESELLVDEVLRWCHGQVAPCIADVGTGSGCVAIALAHALPQARVYAVDCSPAAIRLARSNAHRHAVDHRIYFSVGDLLTAFRQPFPVIVSNPPYVSDDDWDRLQPEVQQHEPRLALAGGPDGLQVHRRLLEQAHDLLEPGGLLALEVGHEQASSVQGLAAGFGFDLVRVRRDVAGIDRVICVQARGRQGQTEGNRAPAAASAGRLTG